MAAWHYVFLFPGPNRALDAANTVASFASHGFKPSSLARRLVPIDENGHLGGFGQEISLQEPFTNDLQNRLRNGEQLFVEITKDDIASNQKDCVVTTIACSFASNTSNSNFSFGWHTRLFLQLPPETQSRYWEAIRDAAKAANAAYVILVDEASDDFEDRFIEVDGRRILDAHPRHQWGNRIKSVWVDHSAGGDCPEGVPNTVVTDIGKGFLQYSLE